MTNNADLQVWLDTTSKSGHMLVVPYVKSGENMDMLFSMEVLQTSASGNSRINQSGKVHAAANRAVPLAQLALGVQAAAECTVQISLASGGHQLGVYRFDCKK
jgi:hypothetical protein